MTQIRRKRTLLLLLFAGFVALNLVARNQARSMMRYSECGSRTQKPETLTWTRKLAVLVLGVNLPRPHGTATPADVGLDFEPVTIPGDKGIRLGAWRCDATDSKATVLLFHGYGADKSSLLDEAKAFHELGCSALLVDFRGSGDSSESYTTAGYVEADDVAAAVRYARTNLPNAKLILFGQSMGGAAILRAICADGVRPDGVIVEAVFDTMLNTVKNRFHSMGLPAFPFAQVLVFWGSIEAGFNGFHFNPKDYARSVTCPTLFLHGSDDPRARTEESRRVFDAASGEKDYREFAGAGHESYAARFPDNWKDAVSAFLEKSGDWKPL